MSWFRVNLKLKVQGLSPAYSRAGDNAHLLDGCRDDEKLKEVLVIMSNPKKSNSKKRPLGFLRGQVWMAPDFDDPWELVETPEGWELRPENLNAAKEPAHDTKPQKTKG